MLHAKDGIVPFLGSVANFWQGCSGGYRWTQSCSECRELLQCRINFEPPRHRYLGPIKCAALTCRYDLPRAGRHQQRHRDPSEIHSQYNLLLFHLSQRQV
jgi:hypothetical protein